MKLYLKYSGIAMASCMQGRSDGGGGISVYIPSQNQAK